MLSTKKCNLFNFFGYLSDLPRQKWASGIPHRQQLASSRTSSRNTQNTPTPTDSRPEHHARNSKNSASGGGFWLPDPAIKGGSAGGLLLFKIYKYNEQLLNKQKCLIILLKTIYNINQFV